MKRLFLRARLLERRAAAWLGDSKRRLFVILAIAVIATGAAVLALSEIPFLHHAERFVDDVRVSVFAAPEPRNEDVVVVAITEETLELFPYRSPIDRGFIADLLRALEEKRVKAIALDILFDQPTEEEKDELLKETIRGLSTPLVVSYLDNAATVNERQLEYLDEFVPERLRAYANLMKDPFDNTVRWIFPGAHGRPGFARAVAAQLGHATPAEPVEINWRGRPRGEKLPFARLPAHAVSVLPQEWFEGKTVLIGADLSLTDRHRTPFSVAYQGTDGMLSGIVTHAYSVLHLLEGRTPPRLPRLLETGFVLAVTLVGAAFWLLDLHLWLRATGGAVLGLCLWAGGIVLFRYTGLLLPLVTPTMAMAAAMWGADAFTGREERRRRAFVEQAFSRYLSPKVVSLLLKDPGKLSIDGERRTMTFIFTDLADFTSLAEWLGSKKLARILNAYLDGVCEIVLEHEGTVDKFIGDAVFAIFNAPTDQPDHAERAVRCALALDAFSERFRAQQLTERQVAIGITRIGVHTGRATVGNFGSRFRIEYTALGDAVNTASRLEGVNRVLGSRICVSEATVSRCEERIPFRLLGSVVVKGKTTALRCYEPLDEEGARSRYMRSYALAMTQLEEHPDRARELFEALHGERPDDRVVALRLERMRDRAPEREIILQEK